MIYELELVLYHARQRRTRVIAAVALSIAVIAASMSSNYSPLVAQLGHAYLVSEGRAPEQVASARAEQAQRETQAQAAAQERQRQAALVQQQQLQQRQQQQQIEQQQRAAQQAAAALQTQLNNTYTTRFQQYQTAWKAMRNYEAIAKNIKAYADEFRELIRQANFYERSGLMIEETASEQGCRNPRITRQVTNIPIYHNLSACITYYARKPDFSGMDWVVYTLSDITYLRGNENNRQYLPLDQVLEYEWTWLIDEQLINKALLQKITVPPLVVGTAFNPAIVPYMNPDYANLLLSGATTEEKIRLRDISYARITALVDAYNGLADACRQLQRLPCVPH